MSEYKLDNISSFLKKRIDSYKTEAIHYHCGTVSDVGDGVVHIKGLPSRMYGELLEFEGGIYGMALNLEDDGVGAVLMDSSDSVCAGDTVKGTGRVAEIPVGNSLIGRVVDSIGRPLDGRPLEAEKYLPSERSAPTIMDRRPVDTPLETGILAIDSMIPIGRQEKPQ